MRISRKFLITGRVQGVGFRYFVQNAAAHEGLQGWVRNLPSGHVEAVAEGTAEAIARFEQQLRQGPPAARVDRVDAVDQPLSLNHTDFAIR